VAGEQPRTYAKIAQLLGRSPAAGDNARSEREWYDVEQPRVVVHSEVGNLEVDRLDIARVRWLPVAEPVIDALERLEMKR